MAVDRLLFSDDFSGYTSDAEVAAAYPHPAGGSGYDSASTDWGVNFGPDGQPGIKDQVSAPARDTGSLEKHFLAPQCRSFKVKGRWNWAATNATLVNHFFLSIEWFEGVTDWAQILQLSRQHASDELRIFIHTLPSHGNVLNGTAWYLELPGVLVSDTPTTLEVNGIRSTIIETSPGVYTPNADGEVNVLINDTVVASFAGPVWNNRDDLNPMPYWNAVQIQTIGAFSDLEIWDETSCDPATFGDRSAIDCCIVAPNTPTGQGASPLLQPSIPTFLDCGGGGLVPILAPVTESEAWWGLG